DVVVRAPPAAVHLLVPAARGGSPHRLGLLPRRVGDLLLALVPSPGRHQSASATLTVMCRSTPDGRASNPVMVGRWSSWPATHGTTSTSTGASSGRCPMHRRRSPAVSRGATMRAGAFLS